MTQHVLARKYRPRQFQDLVGQESLVTALQNALKQKRLHHAYLLTGTRGVGKTTAARILAKAMSCMQGVVTNPCDTCKHCTEINKGCFIDLFEIDAASHTKVDETKEIINKAMYPPSQGPYRIFIIDEVHMLSKHSFNALLKTLEEPPEFVKFILATTNPEKLPKTILSRCLHFNLAALSADRIVSQLHTVLEKEQIPFEKEALTLIAKSAKGSMRDALSLTEPMITTAGDSVITAEIASQTLGLVSDTVVESLLLHILQKDTAAALEIVQKISSTNIDIKHVIEQLSTLIHRLSTAKLIPSLPIPDSLQKVIEHVSTTQLQLYYEITIKGLQQLPFTPSTRQCLEVICLRQIAFTLDKSTIEPIAEHTAPPSTPKKVTESIQRPPTSNDLPVTVDSWPQVTTQLSCSGMTLALLQNTEFSHIDENNVIYLTIEKNKASILNDTHKKRIEKALSTLYNKNIKIHITVGETTNKTPIQQKQAHKKQQHDDTKSSLLADENIQTIMHQFDAKIETVTRNPGEKTCQKNPL